MCHFVTLLHKLNMVAPEGLFITRPTLAQHVIIEVMRFLIKIYDNRCLYFFYYLA